jgi:hypothetical protein
MTDADKQLLAELDAGVISTETFFKEFSVDIKNNASFVKDEIRAAINIADPDQLQMTMSLIWLSGNTHLFIDLLNELLINPNHRSHQRIAKTLQETPSSTTVPFVRKALENNFDYLEYTCSDSDAIAKWFSWLLYAIGTPEAIELMKEYSHSADEGIKKEMLYRLRKVNN